MPWRGPLCALAHPTSGLHDEALLGAHRCLLKDSAHRRELSLSRLTDSEKDRRKTETHQNLPRVRLHLARSLLKSQRVLHPRTVDLGAE